MTKLAIDNVKEKNIGCAWQLAVVFPVITA
jgi:hypothetical protein